MTTTEPTSRTQALPALDQRQRDELDAAVIELASGAERWASTPLPGRAGLLGAVHAAMTGAAQEWAETAAAIKGLHPSSQLVGEEWISGPHAGLAGAGTLAHSIAALSAGTSPLATRRFGTAPGGRITIPVLPTNGHEWLLLHGTATASWGAFPGATIGNVQSGIGTVHNALLIDRPERTIVRGPFRPFPRSFAHGEFTLFPKPPWFVQARSAATTGRHLAGFAAKPSWLKMPAIFLAAFRA